ncbi:MAG: class I SAM-dependent methyltransferase [Chloroflexota bacterium]
MNPDTSAKLLELNREFYQKFARSFSATRVRLQPGVLSILKNIPREVRILDVGCGNGALLRELIRCGYSGHYTGIDFSETLIEEASQSVGESLEAVFYLRDLADPDWVIGLTPPFDRIFAFAVLHHLPGSDLRRQVLFQVAELLNPGGRFIHSNWRFLSSPKLRARMQSWEQIDLKLEDVEPGDCLLDWRRDGYGLRYVHYFTREELSTLAVECGFTVEETFYSDGAGGRLGLYQIWVRL